MISPLSGLDRIETGPPIPIKSLETQFRIMKRTVAKCPSIELIIMGMSVPSMLNSGMYGQPDAARLF